ncbi:MAG TPA: hypothetical protein VNH83_29145 [Bryobacteraceae bacterium]|nr:hypothetical protein [Bryobacteraceae bacterium]
MFIIFNRLAAVGYYDTARHGRCERHLSKYLARVEQGETILVCRGNPPIAEIGPLAARRKAPWAFGLFEGQIKLGPEFFKPLPDELLAYFNGEKP